MRASGTVSNNTVRMAAVTKYRTLLRAIHTVFRGDLHAMSACKGQARAAFMQQANVADPELISTYKAVKKA